MKKWKNLSKRGLALLLALVMCMGMLQITAFAADEHVHNEDGWVCTQGESTRELVCDKHVHDENCYTTERGELTCEAEEHEHGDGCYEAAKPVLICEDEEHEHGADCYDEDGILTCATAEHKHGDGCYTQGEDILVCDKTEHTHGDGCYAVETVKVCEEEDHEHGDECYTVTEGAWTCVNVVQNFLDAVEAIPADINPDNAEEVGAYVYGEVADAYEALLGTGYEDRADVQEAAAVYAAAVEAVQAALEMGTETYALCPAPRDPTEYPTTDGTSISVLKWDFNNIKHPRDYYLYLAGETGPNGESCFERYYANNYFTPTTLQTRTVTAGATAVFGYRPTAANFNGIGYYIPSVYLYDVVEITQGEEWIDGGNEALHFYASEDKSMTALWPYTSPSEPHIRLDVPISATAPVGSTIQIKFRLAYGFDCDWNAYNMSLGDLDHRQDNYYWQCEDFVYTMTVGESGGTTPDVPTADVTAYHDLYIPAGYSTTMSLSKYYNGSTGQPYQLSDLGFEQGDDEIASIKNNEIGYHYNSTLDKNLPIYDNVTIEAVADAQVGSTTTLCITYTGKQYAYTGNWLYGYTPVLRDTKVFLDVITVHIVAPQEVNLDLTGSNSSKTINRQGSSADGTLSSSDVVFRGFENGQTLTASRNTITASSLTATRNTSTEAVTLKAKTEGSATIEHQYHYYNPKSSGLTGYDELTWYVDAINVTVGTPEGDDPNSIDGLDITKTVDKTTAVGGEELVYTITVTNDSGVAKPVTVIDSLPNGTTFVRSDSTEGVTHDNYGNVTWKPTVQPDSTATLKIVVKIDDGAYGTLRNVANLTSSNGIGTKQASVETAVTPKSTPTYNLVVKKTEAESTNAAGDDIVTFTVTVENQSDVSLYNLMLVDTMDKTLEPTQDMEDVQVTVTGNDANTDVVFMGARDDVKAPERDSNGHIVWTDEGGLKRTDGGEDKWDFTWMLEGEFKPNATVELTYSAKIIYPEDADSVAYYNYADAIAGAESTDMPKYDGQQIALFGFVSGGSGGVGGSSSGGSGGIGGGSGPVGGERYKYTLTYDFTGGTWTQNGTTHNDTYKVEGWGNGYYTFTVDGSVQPEKDGYTFENKWTKGGTTYSANASVTVTDDHDNRNVTIYAKWEEKPSVTVNYVTDDGAQLGSIKYYPEQGAAYDHSVGDGTAVPTAGDASTRSPKTITVDGKTYAYDSVKTDATKLTGVMGGESVTITVVYAEDAKGTIGTDDEGNPTDTSDGIPDKYQVKVTFKVENGEWNDGGKDDVVKYVVKYAVDGETMDANGTATLAGVTIPAAGNQPDEGYEAGSWNTEPTEETTVTEDTTYTYNYKAHVHNWVEKKDAQGNQVWKNGQEPDCIHSGTKIRVCSSCSKESDGETVAALGHDFYGAIPADNCADHHGADCTGHTLTCVRCNGTLTGGQETQPHSYGDWTEDTAATMTTEGTKHRECSACGHVENGTIPTLDKVTITIKYVDENGSEVGTKEVEAEKGKPYNVTGDINSNVPEGYEVKEMPEEATGTANEHKTVTVPVVAEAWTVWVNHGNALDGTPTLAWMKGHVAANQYDNTDAANHTRFYAPTNALPCLKTDYTFDHWALNYGDDGKPFVTGTYLVEQDNGELLELHNVWIYDAVFLGHKNVTVEKIFDGEGLTENDLPENFTLIYNNGKQTLTAADATKFTNADGKPGYRWTLNAEVLTYYDWTYCYLEEANTDIKGYTLSGTTSGNADENGKRYFQVRLISYDDLLSWSVEDMMKAPGIPQTFTITNHYTKDVEEPGPDPETKYTVTYDLNGGTSNATLVYPDLEKDSETPTIANPTRSGYTFNGWSPKVADTVTESVTYVAQWTKNNNGGNGNGGGGSTTRYYDLKVSYVYEDGSQAAKPHTGRHASGYSYSVSSPAIEGFTPDQAVVSGRLTGDVTVTVTYKANPVDPADPTEPTDPTEPVEIPDENPPLVDIPEVDPPLVDIPEEDPPLVDIPEEDPPLVDIPENDPPLVDVPGDEPKLDGTPKTGDSSRTTLWAGLCAVSLAGIAVLTGKKKEDEEA